MITGKKYDYPKHTFMGRICHNSGLQIRECIQNFSFISQKYIVVGTQKNHLNETVLLSIQNMFRRLVENNHKFKLRSVVVQW